MGRCPTIIVQSTTTTTTTAAAAAAAATNTTSNRSGAMLGSSSANNMNNSTNNNNGDDDKDDNESEGDDDESVEVQVEPELAERVHTVELQLYQMADEHSQAYDGDDDGEDDMQRVCLPNQLKILLPIQEKHAYPCPDTFHRLPVPPSQWPQAPMMLRPTPGMNTSIRGLRYASTATTTATTTTSNNGRGGNYRHFAGFCAGCILPINTGTEAPGKSLVIDFESDHFVGTVLMRIKDIPTAIHHQHENENDHSKNNDPSGTTTTTASSYFDGKKRRFQAIVKGRFKKALPMSECVTGQVFERPAGKLPHAWIVKSFIQFVVALAPQLEATLEGHTPRFLTPLVATAHTVLVRNHNNHNDNHNTLTAAAAAVANTVANENENDHAKKEHEKFINYNVYAGAADMEMDVEEPPANHDTSILQALPSHSQYHHSTTVSSSHDDNNSHKKTPSVPSRMKLRKKIFNAIAAKHADEPVFDTHKEYTFEFYQHLLLFHELDDLKVDMGLRAIGGKIGLAQALAGQPLKFMAAHKDPTTGQLAPLWSFDLWHQSLYPIAQQHIHP